jgi:PadR family transcriptional regulator PadR
MGEQARLRMTMTTLKVLRVLLDDPIAKRYGLEICRAARLPSGSVYPILMRLERARWLASDWEDVDPAQIGRPRRRLYRLTGEGAHNARAALREAHEAIGLDWGTAPGLQSPGRTLA